MDGVDEVDGVEEVDGGETRQCRVSTALSYCAMAGLVFSCTGLQ